jgi:predicted metal-binding membrane protein
MSFPASELTLTEYIVKKERRVIFAGLLLLTILSWWYILAGAGTGMSTLAMTTWEFPPHIPSMNYSNDWTAAYALTMLGMWWVMMVAMMIPSAAPMILLYARVVRHSQKNSIPQTATFALGYLLAWLGFSLLAVLLQWLLERAGIVHGMMMWSTNYVLSGALLILAGIYQLSSMKAVCLRKCRSPAEFISSHWKMGALQMGLKHGAYCVGCCWGLMALLFVGGAMNLVWIAGLSLIVLAEKLYPTANTVVYVSALLLISSGIVLIVSF